MSYSGHSALGQEPNPTEGSAATLPSDVAPSIAHELIAPLERRRGWVAVPTFDMRQYVQTQFIVAAIGFGFGVTVGAILGDIFGGKRVAPVTKILGNRRRRIRRNSRRTSRGDKRLLLTRDGQVIEEAPLSQSAYLRFKKAADAGVKTEKVHGLEWAVALDTGGHRKPIFECWWKSRPVPGRACVELSPTDRRRLLKNARGARRTTARKRSRGRPTVKPVTSERFMVKMRYGEPVEVEIDRGHLWHDGVRFGTLYDTGTMFRAVPSAYHRPVREFTTMAGAAKYLIS